MHTGFYVSSYTEPRCLRAGAAHQEADGREYHPVKKFFLFITICILFVSCKKQEEFGTVELRFSHTVDEHPIQFNQLIYTNKAGNLYQVNEVKYFISRLFLIDNEGKSIEIKQDQGIHYVDCSLEKTMQWVIKEVPHKNYTAISFVYGLDENDNQSNRFVNPPESNFAWPDVLGGGYHYMQINGKFKNKNGELQNMNIHTGIGQLRDENNEVIQFVHNYFTVKLPLTFTVEKNNTKHITLNMEIQRWFDMPNLYNFDDFGTGIMQNQHAQQLLKENGQNVFEVVISD